MKSQTVKIRTSPLFLKKRYPLRISRWTKTESENVLITLSSGKDSESSPVGFGEIAPHSESGAESVEDAKSQLMDFANSCDLDALSHREVWQRGIDDGLGRCVLAGLDVAIWDLRAKQAQMPLYTMLGLSRHGVDTSVTIGIESGEVLRERVPEILQRTGVKVLKLKLGSPEGIDADKSMFQAVKETSAPFNARFRVDANGGWNLDEALHMMEWLTQEGIEQLEQPLIPEDLDGLRALYEARRIPLFVDESCFLASDIPSFADRVDGVNVKLVKSGGITGALQIVATARAHGLKTMIGCVSESSIGIAGAAAIGGLFDYIDLDSHLNLLPDPGMGIDCVDGRIVPRDVPGHGGSPRSGELGSTE